MPRHPRRRIAGMTAPVQVSRTPPVPAPGSSLIQASEKPAQFQKLVSRPDHRARSEGDIVGWSRASATCPSRVAAISGSPLAA